MRKDEPTPDYAYDISHDDHRDRVAQILARYGRRVQRSVFEVSIEPEEPPEVKRLLGPWLGRDDAFDLYPVDRRSPGHRIQWGKPPGPSEPVVLL